MSFRWGLVAVVLAVLGGCTAAPPPPPPPAPPPLSLVSPAQACLRDLARDHARFRALGSFGHGRCRVANPVRIAAATVPWNHPGILTCAMARRLVDFEADVIQPLARRYFGEGVKEVFNYGTYACRTRRTATTVAYHRGHGHGGRLSEHALGRAIDLAGFELDDGRMVTVRRDWHADGAAGRFLHAVARDSCRYFNVVLTPNHDRLHWNHIHLDIGPYTLCGD